MSPRLRRHSTMATKMGNAMVTIMAALLLFAAMATTAHAAHYSAILTGAAEAPPNDSPGTGTATVNFDPVLHILEIDVTFNALIGETLAAHIHCCTTTPESGIAGVATEPPSFAGFPLGVRSGVYHHRYDTSLASTWHQAFLSDYGGSTTLAEAAVAAAMDEGRAYLNIHSSTYPPGEIRGFFTPLAITPVPEPGAMALLGLGLPALLLVGRRRFRQTT